jgi:hypothetical protein
MAPNETNPARARDAAGPENARLDDDVRENTAPAGIRQWRCSTCRAFYAGLTSVNFHSDGAGECRGSVPSIGLDGTRQWPVVWVGDWCVAWRPRGDAP